MKRLIVALSAILLLTLNGWGEQLKPGEQARASAAAHRREAKSNHRHQRHVRRHHHRHHQAA